MSPSMDRFSTHAAGISSEQSNGSMALHMSPSMTNLNGGQGLDLASFLKAHSLFAGTGTEFTAQLAKKMHLRHFQAGDSIVKEGEIGRAMFFVMKGFVTVTSQDGETVFAELGHGNFFGGKSNEDGG